MPTVFVGDLSIGGSSASGMIKEAMIYANVIGYDLGQKITPTGSQAALALVACIFTEKHDHPVGLLFLHRDYHDSASIVCNVGRRCPM
jgi:Na+/H+ antiporter NhaD/arsenite permease-like protein